MKRESLNALLIDRDFGELVPEAVELLEAWLVEHPESASEVLPIRRTIETTSAAIRRFPELARTESGAILLPAVRFRLMPLALAASIFLLLGGTAWLGFRVGQESARKTLARAPGEPAASAPVHTFQVHNPWARYVLASDPRGGLTIARDTDLEQP